MFFSQASKTPIRQFSSKASLKIKKKLGFIGDGNMAKALCRSIEKTGLIDYSQVYVSSPYINNLDVWKVLGANTTTNNTEVAKNSDVIFLAVKPHLLNEVLDKLIKDSKTTPISNKLFVSILAGISLEDLEKVSIDFLANYTNNKNKITENYIF